MAKNPKMGRTLLVAIRIVHADSFLLIQFATPSFSDLSLARLAYSMLLSSTLLHPAAIPN